MTTELIIDGTNYRTGSLNAKQQFHVARRLAPLIARIGAATANSGVTTSGTISGVHPTDDGIENTGNVGIGGMFTGGEYSLFETLAQAVAGLSDEDCDYIMRVCMGVVSREQSGTWIGVWNKNADQPQFADITVAALMQLAIAVVQDNLGSFTPAQVGLGQQQATTRRNMN